MRLNEEAKTKNDKCKKKNNDMFIKILLENKLFITLLAPKNFSNGIFSSF